MLVETIPIPVKFDRQGHSCNFYAGFGPTNEVLCYGRILTMRPCRKPGLRISDMVSRAGFAFGRNLRSGGTTLVTHTREGACC